MRPKLYHGFRVEPDRIPSPRLMKSIPPVAGWIIRISAYGVSPSRKMMCSLSRGLMSSRCELWQRRADTFSARLLTARCTALPASRQRAEREHPINHRNRKELLSGRGTAKPFPCAPPGLQGATAFRIALNHQAFALSWPMLEIVDDPVDFIGRRKVAECIANPNRRLGQGPTHVLRPRSSTTLPTSFPAPVIVAVIFAAASRSGSSAK